MNENAKSVICNYCGEEMKLIWFACYSERKGGFFQFQCPKCFACTPRVKTQVDYYKEKPSDKELEEGREAALAAAMKRDRSQGKWLIDDYDIKNFTTVTREATDEDTSLMYCSECHGHAGLNGHEDYVPSKYCPNCGAAMRKEVMKE